jgi:hypothetical protein
MSVELSLGEVDTPRQGTFLRGERWVSLTVDGRTVLLNGAVASALSEAMWDIARRSAHGEQRPPKTNIFICRGEVWNGEPGVAGSVPGEAETGRPAAAAQPGQGMEGRPASAQDG